MTSYYILYLEQAEALATMALSDVFTSTKPLTTYCYMSVLFELIVKAKGLYEKNLIKQGRIVDAEVKI